MRGLAEAIRDQLRELNMLANGTHEDGIDCIGAMTFPSTDASQKESNYDARSDISEVVATISSYRQELDMITSAIDCTIRENVILKESLGNLQNEIETMSSGMGNQTADTEGSNIISKREIANLTDNMAIIETALLAANSQKIELQNRIQILEQAEESKQCTNLEDVINVAKLQEIHIDQLRRDGLEIELIVQEISANFAETDKADKQTIKLQDLVRKLRLRVSSRIDVQTTTSNDIPKLSTCAASSKDLSSPNKMYDVSSKNRRSTVGALIPWCWKPASDQSPSDNLKFTKTARDTTECKEVSRSAVMTATVGAHVIALKDRMALLEETCRTDEAALESLKAKNANVEYQSGKSPLKGSLPIGTFAYFRRGDVASLRLQVEHLRLQLHKKDTELESVKLEKVTGALRSLKVCCSFPIALHIFT